MATITTGIISPKSYALSTEPPSVKMSTEPETTDSDFESSCRNFEPVFDSNANTSESESENPLSNRSSLFNRPSDDLLPKRNKRKNFKPRCSNIAYSDLENNHHNHTTTAEALNLSEFSNNNNLKNVRRRKTLSTRKLILESHFTPIDLSAGGRSQNDDDSSDSDEVSDDYTETETDSKIPSSFSITNLSKPHVPDFGNGTTGSGINQGQIVSDMQEYTVNTVRELIGIYGLPPEVAESITRQLPIATFISGKILENLNLGPLKQETTPPSQPPTPPSTPLSPPNSAEIQKQINIPTTLPQLPNVSITRALSPIQSSGGGGGGSQRNIQILTQQQQQQKGPLDLGAKKKKTNTPSLYTNGIGLNLIQTQSQQQLQQQRQQQQSPPTPNLHTDDSSNAFGSEIDALRSKMADLTKMASLQNQSPRGIFPANFMQLAAHIHGEQTSPPPQQPQENNPLNAMLAQSVSPATMSRDSPATPGLLNKTQVPLDYSRYVKRFSSSLECGSSYCKDLNYREHFHCLDCNSRVFVKKEEMIRHFKWHKKRDESLQHGFMRYSPMDDCSDRYHNCSHNRKQTHYHCIKEGCDKVYISTSDVQMHANYHRKDSAIIQEGFQRFRATEECGASYCAFFGQRTTHFHCRRAGCKFTFKNKADMEKHKSYHIKDEQLSRDGFKKFMKHEQCPYENCRFSKVCNHIHCIRPQCNYVLHSSGQLFSHKRKHERKDSELAYRKFKLAQSMMRSLQEGGSLNMSLPQSYEQAFEGIPVNMIQQNSMSNSGETSSDGRVSPVSYDDFESTSAMDLSANDGGYNSSNMESDPAWNNEDFWRKYLQFFAGHEKCYQNCELSYSEHYHCMVENCDMLFTCRDGVREHARNHEQQEQVTEAFYITVDAQNGRCDDSCIYQDKDRHYHCNWDNCREVILPTDKPFRRLDHYKMHEYSRKLSLTKDPLTMTHLATSIDGMFRRKRGRPPKNRVIEVWNDYSPVGGQGLMDSPQAIFTSFKLPKPSTSTPSSSRELETENSFDDRSNSSSPTIADYNLQGFDVYSENCKCSDVLCPYLGNVHYHCNQIRCLYVTDRDDVLLMHSKDFHDNIEILEGFEFYDRNVDCRLLSCHSNKVNRHFHCTRENCNYSFVQYSTMAIHNQKHVNNDEPTTPNKKDVRIVSPEVQIKKESTSLDEKLMPPQQENHFRAINLSSQLSTENKVSVVKASGTFYPLSTLPSERTSPTEPPKNSSSESNQLQETTNSSSHTLYGPDLSCSRPFCKLKRKPHYHCNACNQAFSEVDKLVTHIAKHSSGALSSQMSEDNNNRNSPNQSPIKAEPKIQVAPLQSLQNPIIPSPVTVPSAQPPPELENHSPIFSPPTFDGFGHFANFPSNLATQFALMSQQSSIQNAFLPQSLYQNTGIPPQLMFQHPGLIQNQYLTSQSQAPENMTSPLAAMAANLNKRALSPHEMSPEQKKARIQSSMRILKDEPVPDGYLRFRFNEDCQYTHCGYREHQTHFHCQRQDCGYSFCDKTRFVQHTARHERLDTLMGGDFQQYRANVACGRQECAYTSNLGSTQNKASHFHCLKCDFVCTDTNKVVAHRRQHQKLDSIQAAGFEKFTPSQQCRSANCQHSGKQTHYHCLSCQYAVLGLAQMSAHKYRHLEG